MRAFELITRLRGRFAYPEYVLLTEVRNAAGFRATRSADAMAMGTWSSRGLWVHGFEVKVSRGDWMSEKKNPAKAEEGMRHCDYAWLVVADADIVRDGELPIGWGLLAPHGKGLRTLKEAERREGPFTKEQRSFMAAMLRRAGALVDGYVPREEFDEAVRKSIEEREDADKAALLKRIDQLTNERDGLLGQIATFEKDSGMRLREAARLGRHVAFLQRHGLERFHDALRGVSRTLEGLQSHAQSATEELAVIAGPCECGHDAARHDYGGWPRELRCQIALCPCGMYAPTERPAAGRGEATP